MVPAAAADRYRRRQRIVVATLALTRTVWRDMGADFDASFAALLARLLFVVESAQTAAARGADDYADALAPGEGPAGEVDPAAFAGWAGDGRPLATLLTGAVVASKNAVANGRGTAEALAVGGRWLDMAAHTLVADAGRAADSVAIASRPYIGGYVRMLNPPSCGRCAVLAGKFFKWNAGFQRHPRCDCLHIPANEDRAGDFRTDPRAAVQSGNVTGLTRAERRAIADGADVSQVVNARRGMSTADVFGRRVQVTTEGTTLRGVAGRRLADGGLDQTPGSPYRTTRTPRLTPESIYRLAADRDDAIRLLRRFGYFL